MSKRAPNAGRPKPESVALTWKQWLFVAGLILAFGLYVAFADGPHFPAGPHGDRYHPLVPPESAFRR
jgi:hypothetical protein